MINVRKNVFETNSSSTHAICIAKTNKQQIPENIEINFHDYEFEFGWEEDKRYGTNAKLAYLLIGILDNNNINEASKKITSLSTMLEDFGVKSLKISGIEIHHYESAGEPYFDEYPSYVDHSNELRGFVETLLENPELLKEYLFNDDSFILTGNDNSDDDISINVNYEYEEFYKGN